MIRDCLDAVLRLQARRDARQRGRRRGVMPGAMPGLRPVALSVCLMALSWAALAMGHGDFGMVRGLIGDAPWQDVAVALGLTSAALCATGLILAVRLVTTSGSSEESRYRLLALNMSEVISCHRRNGTVQFISPAAEAMLGTPVARLLKRGLFDCVHVADRPAYLTALSEAAQGGEARSVELRLKRDAPSKGPAEFIWVEMRCRKLDRFLPGTSAGEGDVIAVMREITQRKIQEEALELARNAAGAADAAKTRFLAIMSHELRTPLNAIIGFSEMIARDLNGTRRREYAELITDSGQHLLSVVNGILDMSRMESGNLEISPEPFAPRPALLNCCNLVALKARESGVDLAVNAPQDLPLLCGDPRAFKQIVLNLLSNAIKFTEPGGRVTVSARVEGAQLVLCVNDTGVGIAADDLKRIGDPFFQAGKTAQRRHEGTGLGLCIVKSLVALHSGDMAVQSNLGEGTAVTVALPLVLTRPRAAQAGDNIASLTSQARKSPQVKRRA